MNVRALLAICFLCFSTLLFPRAAEAVKPQAMESSNGDAWFILDQYGQVWRGGASSSSEEYLSTFLRLQPGVEGIDLTGWELLTMTSRGNLLLSGIMAPPPLFNPSDVESETMRTGVLKFPLTGVRQVLQASRSFGANVVLRKDGTVWTWGSNPYLLGRPAVGKTLFPDAASSEKMDAAWERFYYERHNPSYPEASETDERTPARIPELSGIRAITGNGEGALALQDNGALWFWGILSAPEWRSVGSQFPVKVLDNVRAVRSNRDGGGLVLAVKNDDTLWAWGEGYDGVLNDNDEGTDKPVPEFAYVLDNVDDAFASERSAVIRRKDGSIWGWGLQQRCSLPIPDMAALEPAAVPQRDDTGKGHFVSLRKLLDDPDIIPLSARTYYRAGDGSFWVSLPGGTSWDGGGFCEMKKVLQQEDGRYTPIYNALSR